MTVTLIIGAAGFTGRHLAPLLAERGHEVHGLVASDPGNAVNGLSHLHVCNLNAVVLLSAAIAAAKPDFIVHLAGVAFVVHDDVKEMYESNIVGTRNLLEAALGSTKKPRAILLASSANIYGNASIGPITEGNPL